MGLVDFLAFFGYICNFYGEEPINASLVWYYQLFFKVTLSKNVFGLKFIPILPLILIFIGFYITVREEVSLKGIKISLYFVPLTNLLSILWYWITVDYITGEPLILLFGTLRGYLTILLTMGCILLGSYIGIKVKQYKLLKRNQITERNL